MNQQDQQLAIAQFCGWYDFGTTAPERGCMTPRLIGRFKENMDRHLVPDFPNDSNAMRQAKSEMSENHLRRFTEELLKLLRIKYRDCLMDWSNEMLIVLAKPEEEAEILLQVIGKWKDA